MPREERFGTRDLTYGIWHRVRSLARFIGFERAQSATMVDVDAVLWLETEPGSKEPLCLVEVARDVGQSHKPATAIAALAERANVPAYCVLYSTAPTRNPTDARVPDISRFRVRRLWPRPELAWRDLSPQQWSEGLLRIRGWSAARLNIDRLMAANDDRYFDEPPAMAVRSMGRR